MSGVRTRPLLFAVIAGFALLVRLLVPAGFMPQVAKGQVAIVACSGVMPGTVHARGHEGSGRWASGHEAPGHDAPGHDGFERPCAFAAVAAAATLLAVAIVVALPLAPRAARFAPLTPPRRVRAALRWRPPLRAPPTILLVR